MYSDHAKNAFERISMQKYKSLPIYLEWAPVSPFEAAYQSEAVVVDEVDSKTLFVKNLDFTSTKEALEAHLASAGTIKSVKVVTKNGLPCGYGFVEYEDEKAAKKALRNLNNTVLDGHALKLSVAKTATQVTRPKREREAAVQEPTQTKMLVKNLAFEADAKELKTLFSNYGHVKHVRIPKKYAGGHRGFAFVEFVSAEEAAAAFGALKNTHMYGRKLVIEWAKQDDSLGEARKRAKQMETTAQTKAQEFESKGSNLEL
jgi:multiple RNA-binding domain-containing protein 1